MTHKSLFTALAAVTLLTLSSGADAAECLRGDRTGTIVSDTVHRTDRMFQRIGDRIVRTGDRVFGWFQRRPRA